MDNSFFIENYTKYVELVFNKEIQGKGVHVYHKIYRFNPIDLVKNKPAPQSEADALEFIKNLFKEEIEAYIPRPPVKKRVSIINGIAELEDEGGNYLGRICEDALSVDMDEYNIIVVKVNGDLLLSKGGPPKKLIENVASARIRDAEILVTKRDGETGTCDFNGFYLRDN
jgi:hypothetical protein